jgi:hypothetical protein
VAEIDDPAITTAYLDREAKARETAVEHYLVTIRRVVDGQHVMYHDLVHESRLDDYMTAEAMAPGEILSMDRVPIRLRHRWWERHITRPAWDRR